jgi:hypothetical protein
MLALLMPSFLGTQINRNSRITLGSVPDENSHLHWGDLMDFLKSLPKSDAAVLTDPITGYIVNAMTQHEAYNYKFFPGIGYHSNPFVFGDYTDKPLTRYPGSLLIVNRRNGGHSRIGQLSGHWYPDVLYVSHHYPRALVDHLEENPDDYHLLWRRDRISVYQLQYPGSNF